MIPVVQSIVGDGKDGRPYGDCIRACVASIFELPIEQVPHFAAAEGNAWPRALARWLKPFHLAADRDDYREQPSRDWPRRMYDGWWIASVVSENIEGATHAVVMHEDKVVHDPSPFPRRTPYVFVGATWFCALDPALIARAVRP